MKITHTLLALAIPAIFSQAVLAAPVSAGGAGTVGILTDLGFFASGSYNITGSGTVGLTGYNDFIQGKNLVQPNGQPVSTVTDPNYLYFNPYGSYSADGNYGAAGLNAKIGALIGTFSATPTSPSDWFLIGYSTQVTLDAPGHIYASVNDTYHNNNFGSYEANISAVPVPAALPLMLSGIGVLGFAFRQRKGSLAA